MYIKCYYIYWIALYVSQCLNINVLFHEFNKQHRWSTCSVIHAIASITRATTSERRTALNARFTDKASVVLPDDATAAFFLIPAVSVRRNFWKWIDEQNIVRVYRSKL